MIFALLFLFVAGNGPDVEGYGEGAEAEELGQHVGELAAFQVYEAHYFGEILQGVDGCQFLYPIGHAFYGSEHVARHEEEHDEEEYEEHGLL